MTDESAEPTNALQFTTGETAVSDAPIPAPRTFMQLSKEEKAIATQNHLDAFRMESLIIASRMQKAVAESLFGEAQSEATAKKCIAVYREFAAASESMAALLPAWYQDCPYPDPYLNHPQTTDDDRNDEA
jgi:hypothetical protein